MSKITRNQVLDWVNGITHYNIQKEWIIGRLKIKFEARSKKNLWGRFGGGWNWKLGVQGGSTTWIFSLLIATLSFYWRRKEEV